jgi:FeS assembly SUF system regulator
MVRLSRMTDYGIVLLCHFAAGRGGSVRTARDLAAASHLPLPTVSKLLKQLARGELLEAQRGVRGGYRLARPAQDIRLDEVLGVLEGPVALTVCSTEEPRACTLESHCVCEANWRLINRAVRDALSQIRLADMAEPRGAALATLRGPGA